jgi:hypothetical protein
MHIAESLVSLAVVMLVGATAASQPIYESEPVTGTATIEAIDKATRVVTLKTAAGAVVDVTAPAEMEGFNSLRVGDQVSATYYEAVVVHLSKPGDPAPSGTPTTIVRRKDRQPGSETMRQRTVRVTVDAVDTKAPSLTVKTQEGRVRTLTVTNAALLQNIKPGDALDATVHESLLVSVTRPRK